MRILYFLEDRAQEGFVKALVERIAKDESIPAESLIPDIRSARGGYRIIKEFRNFMKDTIETEPSEVDLLIVAIDGNCKGRAERVRELGKCIKPTHPLRDKIVYAVPDPHIERWYIMDQRAFKDGVGLERVPDMPQYKCKKDYYKQILNQTLRESNINSLLTGAEYGEKIVENIEDLESFCRLNSGCQTFMEDLRNIFRQRVRR
jgi:hypothetical protein